MVGREGLNSLQTEIDFADDDHKGSESVKSSESAEVEVMDGDKRLCHSSK